ncbi:MAG TPA: hypothetical protein VE176_06610, partial [Candidatus Limnocylindrales bacterium]|nr:hypothetical protein [Candidatus Limnocylindrales bacterium]
MSAERETSNSSKESITKIAVAARLLARELHHLKLKWVDLARADRRLGEKAYATRAADGQPEVVSQVDELTRRVTQLRQQKFEAACTFSGKAKAFASKIGKAIQLGVLHLRCRRILKQLGA